MQSLATSLLSTAVWLSEMSNDDRNTQHSFADLHTLRRSNLNIQEIQRSKLKERHSNEYVSTQRNPWYPLMEQFTYIQNELEQIKSRCEQRKFDMECLQKQIDINLNVVSPKMSTNHS